MPLENFGTPTAKREFKSDFKKTEFVDLNGTSTVRILTNDRMVIETHFINKATVRCLEEDCPICASNKMLIMQYPESFREEARYSPRRTVKLVNVLDKTLVRKCSECGTDNKGTGTGAVTCYKCSSIVTSEPTPSNKVKVLSRGVTLFDQLDAINNAIQDTKGEPLGLTAYDITFVVSGTGKNKVITPIAGQPSPLTVEVNKEDLFDLDKVTIKLTATELVDLQRGVSLRDIFSARKASEKVSTLPDDSYLTKEIVEQVGSDVDTLFKQ